MAISRRALRTVFGYPYRADVRPILSRNKLMCLSTRLQLRLFIFTYRCIHDLGSPLIHSIFKTRESDAHTTARTRAQSFSGLALPSFRSRYGMYSLSFLAADRFNSLPAAIRSTSTLYEFRKLCLEHLGYPVKRP